ncbi:MAG TPA: hypothetical protein VGK34_05225 [Armatimonadota bacterium]|jgi:rubrerythrin
MPEFLNPFTGVVSSKMTDSELVRAIMLNIAAELEAVHLYTAHMDATDNEDAKKVLFDIANEEIVHVGEFTSLLYRLNPLAAQKVEEGFAEVEALLQSKAPTATAPEAEGETQMVTAPQGLTVGSLLGQAQELG